MSGLAGLDDALGRIYLHRSREMKKKHRRSYACHDKLVYITFSCINYASKPVYLGNCNLPTELYRSPPVL